jgi:hypothetical protein
MTTKRVGKQRGTPPTTVSTRCEHCATQLEIVCGGAEAAEVAHTFTVQCPSCDEWLTRTLPGDVIEEVRASGT